MNKLEELRKQIDEIDAQIAVLFEKRMHVAKEIGEYKKANNLPVLDFQRELEVISKNLENIKDESLKEHYKELLEKLMSLSKDYQSK